MKQYIATTALCLMAASPLFAQTNKRIMTVTMKNGQTVEYKVNHVENVTFTDMDVPSLRNQVMHGKELTDIDKVTMRKTENGYVFNVYAAQPTSSDSTSTTTPEGETPLVAGTPEATTPVLTITLSQELMGEEVDLGQETTKADKKVTVAYYGEEQPLTGTLQVRLNKGQAIITLEAETEDYTDLRCKSNKTYAEVFEASNKMSVTNATLFDDYAIASAFVRQPSAIGEATTFAFGDVEATDAKGLLNGKVGLTVGIAASKVYNGTIDLTEDMEALSEFKLIDYSTRNVYDKVKSGTITTAKDSEGKLYIKLHVTMDDNRVVELEFYGNTTEVESLDDMIPAAVSETGYKLFNADGSVLMNQTIGMALYKQKNTVYTFYLYGTDVTSKYSSERVTLQVDEKFINAGEVDLSALKDGDNFQVKYSNIQLYSPDAKYGGFSNTPDNGKLTISRDDAGKYSISLDIVNTYTNSTTPNGGGDKSRLVLNYQGTFDKY